MALEYQVLLSSNSNHGYAWCHHKKRFYVSYFVSKNGGDPKQVREWLDVETREEAKAERDRRYTELLLAGAKYKGLRPIFKKTYDRGLPQPNVGHDEGLTPETVEVVKWKVHWRGVYVGYSFDKEEARDMRDKYARQWNLDNMFQPCAVCGEKPRFIAHYGIGHEHQKDLTHDTEGCPNQVLLYTRRMNQGDKVAAWNEFFCTGTFGMTGKIRFNVFVRKVEAFRTQQKKEAKQILRQKQREWNANSRAKKRNRSYTPTKEQPHWYQGKPKKTHITSKAKEKLDISNKIEE